jgi:hypothetical protein
MEAGSLPRPYSDSGATGSGRQFLFDRPDLNTTTSPRVPAACRCTVSTSDRSAAERRRRSCFRWCPLAHCCLRIDPLLRAPMCLDFLRPYAIDFPG